ncbi:MAG: DUF5678 domain-containing protein [Pyrinomonadaceae bacterium]
MRSPCRAKMMMSLPDLLTALVQPIYHGRMNTPVIIEDHPMPPELGRVFEQARRNLLWFSEHVEELEVYKRHRGRYVAAAGGELFVADTPEEVERLAHEKHPDEMPHVRYIPREKRSRIYAC